MERLKSDQDRLSSWLSRDPDYILDQCGDILTRNEFREVDRHSGASEKTSALLKLIVRKGEDVCQSFLEVLRKNQDHFPQLKQLFHLSAAGSASPTVFADRNCAVTARQITDLRGKSLSMTVETASHPGSGPSGERPSGAAGGPAAHYTATNDSVICADRMSGIHVDGDVRLSVSVKSSPAGGGGHPAPPPQGPAVKTLVGHKVALIDCLMADPSFILQHAHQKHVVTDRQYRQIKHSSHPEAAVTELIDQVIGRSEESCSRFLEVLREPDVLETFPKLRSITDQW